MVMLVLLAVAALSLVACGDDDNGGNGSNGTGGGSTAEAVAPSPKTAFQDFTTALEPEGYVVTPLRGEALDGAEAGVSISGDRSGSARSFATSAEAQDYADRVAMEDDKTTIVGTVVFQAPTQDDADFFADAYEG